MAKREISTYQRALQDVEKFNEKNIAVMPEKPGTELLRYVAQRTGEDVEKLAQFYAYFIAAGRLDSYAQDSAPTLAGFAEE